MVHGVHSLHLGMKHGETSKKVQIGAYIFAIVLMLGFIGREVGDRWEQWRDYLRYGDYVVLAGIVALIAWLLIRRRRGGDVTAATESGS